jgi:hypothetical protein
MSFNVCCFADSDEDESADRYELCKQTGSNNTNDSRLATYCQYIIASIQKDRLRVMKNMEPERLSTVAKSKTWPACNCKAGSLFQTYGRLDYISRHV